MAAETQPQPLTRKPILLQRVEGSPEVVNMAVIVPKEEGVISVSEDRTVRVWLKRDSGQYWPSIYHVMPSPCSCMSFNPETRRLSIGLDNGTISEFLLSEDYNKMTPVKNYQAHQSRVTMILFVLELEWVLSTGQDKQFTWHCSESGQRLGGHRTSAVASGLQFDVETRHVFIGDHSGQVTILKLEQDNCTLVTTFRGHTGGVTALCWDPVQRVLFSGSSDHSVIMWDIGGRKGTAIELQGHNDKVQALSYAQHTRQLISCGGDGGIVVWNMDVDRQEALAKALSRGFVEGRSAERLRTGRALTRSLLDFAGREAPRVQARWPGRGKCGRPRAVPGSQGGGGAPGWAERGPPGVLELKRGCIRLTKSIFSKNCLKLTHLIHVLL
ncbi:WD repeat and FYVE domain-containing protein 2 isoform X2 [Dasypus novemcinctus]|uniref:WD repeat and FYVE domain-containing protein 2 isoform X2 n=1 Tax=Dasypus novemcinctus TaxID=9361 RepID=UPI00265E49F0|nr:WD repeat and FYVE domain-containing protein 2 isoform X2 [Dasypus novemcinctus]